MDRYAYARFLRGYQYGFLSHDKHAQTDLTKAFELENRGQLALELLKMFGGQPPNGSPDPQPEDSPSQ